ncbi:hypothetical protein [Natronococcus roseus]|uniref:hypothetical protein n=1 Tax=Natronococcus roseus TaxID=1052014 RepID=UPI00374DACAC
MPRLEVVFGFAVLITLAFATISLVAAIDGCVVGLAVRLVVDHVRRRRAGRTESEGK